MKKVLLVAVLALALPAVAFSANSFDNVKTGSYTGTMKSVVPEMNNKQVTMNVTKEGNGYKAAVKFPDGFENWYFDNSSLKQTELDPKTNKAVMEYTAKATKNLPNGVVYNVNCKDASKKECDAGIDSRANWTLESGNNTLTYKYTGVARTDAFKNEVKPSERIVIDFKYNDTTKTK